MVKIFSIVACMALLSAVVEAKLCKWADEDGSIHYRTAPDKPTWRQIECYENAKSLDMGLAGSGGRFGESAPSILPECLDSGQVRFGVGASARARECTRQLCTRREYQEKVSKHAFGSQQSTTDEVVALTCITRKEQDMLRK